MKLLILGGTRFLGRALVDAALQRGHEVTLFNRGQSNPDLYPQIKCLKGDRDGGLSVLEGQSWDAVIDTCGYFPRVVRQSAEFLADKVKHYTFISTISVYADFSKPAINENSETGKIENESLEEITGESYGPLKALCEKAVEENLPGRVLVIRPGLIVGPHDVSDRFTYWPVRIAKGGEVLAPGSAERLIQVIDVRDLAEWNIRLIEENVTGVFNATGLDTPLSMGTFLETCRNTSGSDAGLTWVSEDFLLEKEVGPWIELPVWMPSNSPEGIGLFAADISKALKSGLTFRPLAETVKATLDWANTRPAEYEWRAGMKTEREEELLKLWHKA